MVVHRLILIIAILSPWQCVFAQNPQPGSSAERTADESAKDQHKSGLFQNDVWNSKLNNNEVRHHWVVLDNGSIRGRVGSLSSPGNFRPLAGMDLKLLRRGQLVGSSKTNQDGMFVFGGIGPGVHSLIGFSREAFIAYAFRVVLEENSSVTAQTNLQIDTLAIPAPFTTAARIIGSLPGAKQRMQRSSMQRSSMRLEESQLFQGLVPASRASFRQPDAIADDANGGNNTEVLSQPAGNAGGNLDPTGVTNAQGATSIMNHSVYMHDDGVFRGAIRSLTNNDVSLLDLSGLTVYVIQNDREVVRKRINRDGSFEIPNMRPGVYGFIVAGGWGKNDLSVGKELSNAPTNQTFAAVQFDLQVVPNQPVPDTDASVPQRGPRFVAFVQNGFQNAFEIAIVPQQDMQQALNFATNAFGTPFPSVFPTGAFGPGGLGAAGTGAGAGGTGATGAGLGALGAGAGIAGLAVGLTSQANQPSASP